MPSSAPVGFCGRCLWRPGIGRTLDSCLITANSNRRLCNRNCTTNVTSEIASRRPHFGQGTRYPLTAKDSASAKQSRKNRKLSRASAALVSAATVSPCSVRSHVHSHSASSPSPRGVRVLEQSEALTALASAVCPWTLSHPRSRHQPTVSRDLD